MTTSLETRVAQSNVQLYSRGYAKLVPKKELVKRAKPGVDEGYYGGLLQIPNLDFGE